MEAAPAPAVAKQKLKGKAKAKGQPKSKPTSEGQALETASGQTSAAKSDTGKEGATRVIEAIQRDARLRLAVQRHTYSLQCKLLETVDADYLTWAMNYITPENYSDVTVERGLEGRCGFPTCSNAIAKKAKDSSRFHISVKDKQVYELPERAYFCSDKCAIASQRIKQQISDEAVHLRPHVIAEYDEKTGTLMPKHREPTRTKAGPFGNLTVHENPAPAPPSTEFSGTFAVEGYTPSLEMSNAPTSVSRPAAVSAAPLLPVPVLLAKEPAKPPMAAPAAVLPTPEAAKEEAERKKKERAREKQRERQALLQLNLFGELWTVLARWCTARTLHFLFPDFDPWKDGTAAQSKTDKATKSASVGVEGSEGDVEREPVLLRPAVDSEEPEVVRARLAMDMLARYLPLLSKELGFNFMVEQELRDLCATFDFFHPVDLSRPVYCTLYTLVLLEALTPRHAGLAKVLHADASGKLIALASQYGLSEVEFNGLAAIFRPPPSFTPPEAKWDIIEVTITDNFVVVFAEISMTALSAYYLLDDRGRNAKLVFELEKIRKEQRPDLLS